MIATIRRSDGHDTFSAVDPMRFLAEEPVAELLQRQTSGCFFTRSASRFQIVFFVRPAVELSGRVRRRTEVAEFPANLFAPLDILVRKEREVSRWFSTTAQVQ